MTILFNRNNETYTLINDVKRDAEFNVLPSVSNVVNILMKNMPIIDKDEIGWRLSGEIVGIKSLVHGLIPVKLNSPANDYWAFYIPNRSSTSDKIKGVILATLANKMLLLYVDYQFKITAYKYHMFNANDYLYEACVEYLFDSELSKCVDKLLGIDISKFDDYSLVSIDHNNRCTALGAFDKNLFVNKIKTKPTIAPNSFKVDYGSLLSTSWGSKKPELDDESEQLVNDLNQRAYLLEQQLNELKNTFNGVSSELLEVISEIRKNVN